MEAAAQARASTTPELLARQRRALKPTTGAQNAVVVTEASLRTFYEQHNPANMQKVDQILAQHHGREEQLFATLRQKCVPALTAGPLV